MAIFAQARQALQILLGNRVLFLLAFVPGVLTLAFTSLALYLLWKYSLHDLSKWLSYPLLALSFPFLWIIFGNIALVPVEDRIVDRVQLALWDEVRVPSPDFAMGRLVREIKQSLFITVFFAVLLLAAAIPGMALLSYVFGAWATAWNFLVTVYNRRHVSRNEKLRAFFGSIGTNTLLGMLLNFLLFVPIVNVWLLGYALVLATVVEMQRPTR